MRGIIYALADTSSVRYDRRALTSAMADSAFMLDDAWRDRLKAAIKKADKSLREVSLAAGAAPGYLSGVFNEGKEPTLPMLFAVCDAVPVSPIHVLLGVDAAPEDVAILRALHTNPNARDAILALIGVKAAPRSGE